MKFIEISAYYEFNDQGILTDSSMRIVAKFIAEQTSIDDICRYYARIPSKCSEIEIENLKINYQARIYSHIKANEETIAQTNSIMLNHYPEGAEDWLMLMYEQRRGRTDEQVGVAALEYLNRTSNRTIYDNI